MRVLSVGSDERVFDTTSAVHRRQMAYAQRFNALDIVVPSTKCTEAVRDGNMTVYAATSVTAAIFFKVLWARIGIAGAVAGVIHKNKPDVVSVQDPFEYGMLTLVGMMGYRIPFHVQVHTDFLSPAYVRHSLLNRLRVVLAGFVLRRATRIRVVSERIKDSIEKRYHPSVPITVLPIFVETEKFVHAQPLQKFQEYSTKVLVVARLEKEKNVALAIEAFAVSASKDSCLVIVGEGSERSALERLARECGVAERVFFEGSQEPAPYYASADIVLVTSRYEGYGLVIIEALAAGKPVLSTDVGIAREVGAIVSRESTFAADLKEWFENGPRTMELKGYPYENFEQYVQAYCDDIAACVKG